MFVRRKQNKSGSFSITVVDKSRGKYDVVKSFGTVRTTAQADLLENKAREWVREREGDSGTLFDRMDESQLKAYAATLEEGRIELAGPELICGELYHPCLSVPEDEALFRHLVLCRVFDPGSKMRVRGYLKRYLGADCQPETIYGLVDRLHLTGLPISPGTPVSCVLVAAPHVSVPLCVLVSESGTPVAARFLDRKLSGARLDQAVQRFARKWRATEPVAVIRRGPATRNLAKALRISKKDLDFKPMSRRLRGRVEGHCCVCLAACAIERQLGVLMREAGIDVPMAEVRKAIGTLYRLNYVSPYTGRPKSVLVQMTPLQKRLFDLIQNQKYL